MRNDPAPAAIVPPIPSDTADPIPAAPVAEGATIVFARRNDWMLINLRLQLLTLSVQATPTTGSGKSVKEILDRADAFEVYVTGSPGSEDAA